MRILTVLLVLVSVLAACSAAPTAVPSPSPSPTGPVVTIGSAADAESQLLAHVMAELLRAARMRAQVEGFADPESLRQALELRAIDVMPGYTGEAWLEVMERADPPGDVRDSFLEVEAYDRNRHDILWMRPTFADSSLDSPPANATFAFVVQGIPSVNADLDTMSRLAARLSEQPDAVVCVDQEFAERQDGLEAVWTAYGVGLGREVFAASPEDAVRGVRFGDCLAGLATATSGSVWLAGERPLLDDLRVFPAFVVTPVLTQDVRDARPEVLPALGPLPNNLTTRMLGEWNARVASGEPIETVAADAARQLLVLAGRVQPSPPATPAGT